MDAMDRLNVRSEYQILNDAIKDEIRWSASSVVRLGYMLRQMMDGKLWEGHYSSLDDYLRQELHMDYTMACRFEAINRKYSIGGRSGNIDEKWEDYSQSVLIEMLNMPPELEAKVTPDMTVSQVRDIKRQARQEKEKEKVKAESKSTAEKSVAGSPVTVDVMQQAHGAPWEELGEPDQQGLQGSGYQAASVQGEILDAEFREVELQETVATSQCPELDRPDKKINKYLDDFAEDFIFGNLEWIQADYRNRAQDVASIPGEIKKYLGQDERVQYFKSKSESLPELMHINLFDDYIQLCTGIDTVLGNFDWFYLAAAIQRKWPTVIEKMANAGKESELDVVVRERTVEPQDTDPGEQDGEIRDELAEVYHILEKEQKVLNDYLEVAEKDGEFPERLMFKQKAIVAALEAYACSLEAESEAAQEQKEQPPLPLLKNNDQRKGWLRAYKDWGLWYRDENIGAEYYKYDFENGARLIAEVYQEETKYCDAYESSHFHLVGGPKPQKDQNGVCRWQWHKKYCRYPNSETELVEFLKEVQKNGKTDTKGSIRQMAGKGIALEEAAGRRED